MLNSVNSAEKKCRVSLGAPYSSVIAALSQNESAELRISFVKGIAGFLLWLCWALVEFLFTMLRQHCAYLRDLSCQILDYVEKQGVANFSV